MGLEEIWENGGTEFGSYFEIFTIEVSAFLQHWNDVLTKNSLQKLWNIQYNEVIRNIQSQENQKTI